MVEEAQACRAVEFRGLQALCESKLEESMLLLVKAQSALADPSRSLKTALRTYRSEVLELKDLERYGVFALKNADREDSQLSNLLHQICGEINYPLSTPVVSHTSQDDFEIVPDYKLLRVPLLEGRFLLRLPDLYHELCHPLMRPLASANSRVKPLSDAFLHLRSERDKELNKLATKNRRRTEGSRFFAARDALWYKCWIETWLEEFICDAFGAYCAGPAYGWCHYSLRFRNPKPFRKAPEHSLSTHPDDHARMLLILAILRTRGFAPEASAIERAWNEIDTKSDERQQAMFDLCYPAHVLEQIADISIQAFSDAEINGLNPDNQPKVVGLLQDAWSYFWTNGEDSFEAWESAALKGFQDLKLTE